MKSVQFFLLIWMYSVIESKDLDNKLSFVGCDQDGWKVKNISIVTNGNTLNFTANIFNSTSEKSLNTSRAVGFILTECDKNFTCSNFTNLTPDSSNCTGNLTEFENEQCTVIKVIEDWVHHLNNLTLPHDGGANALDGCILYETSAHTSETTQKPTRDTNNTFHGFLLDPFLKHLIAHPSIIF